ncbi:DinB family protein [Algoriphagus jejuensis]|uniref:DinB family protein n=1 Tax=Algoriphagus jejuensis TaxID=419934 RepID=A0ABP3YBV5_9BACT
MESLIKTWKTGRRIYLDYFEKYNLEQLNKVPDGFNNNLIWNIGHIIVAQQSLIYRLSNLPMHVSNELYDTYKPGSKPTAITSQAEAEELKKFLISLVDQTQADLSNGVFQTFTERETATGFLLSTLEDSLHFNNYHEGLHLGYMMSIGKFL